MGPFLRCLVWRSQTPQTKTYHYMSFKNRKQYYWTKTNLSHKQSIQVKAFQGAKWIGNSLRIWKINVFFLCTRVNYWNLIHWVRNPYRTEARYTKNMCDIHMADVPLVALLWPLKFKLHFVFATFHNLVQTAVSRNVFWRNAVVV